MKIYRNTVSDRLSVSLEKLFTLSEVRGFRLVGGTSLSLQLGHRESEDIDLFTDAPYGTVDFPFVYKAIGTLFPYADGYHSSNRFGISCFIGQSGSECVKLDMYHTETFHFPSIKFGNVIISSLEDVLLMKLGIVGSVAGGRKKDFWDIHELLDRFSLEQMLELYFKYTISPMPLPGLLDKLRTFHQADDDFTPRCLRGKYWELIKLDLIEETTRVGCGNSSTGPGNSGIG